MVLKNGRNLDCTVLLLMVLEQGYECPANRDGGAVERVDELRCSFRRWPEPAGEPSCLEVGCVRARCQLPVSALARNPGLAVELPGCRAAKVTDSHVNHPVRQAQITKDPLLDREDSFLLLTCPVRFNE